MGVHRSGLSLKVHAPESLQELLPREGLIFVPDKHQKAVVLHRL